jgi:molybdate transport system substrate-binding protein
MSIGSLAAAAKIGFVILLVQGVAAEAAEVKVMSANPMTEVMKELGPQFERATGHKLVIQYEVAGVVKRRIDAGETFDVAILLPPLIEDLIKQGKIAAGTRADIARSGMGVGVRAGAPKPDIRSVEAFKRALLDAKSVAYSKEGASGVYFLGLLERLGIAEGMKPKLKPTSADTLANAVPSGEAEMIVVPITVIMVPGAELVGPLPTELQTYINFSAGVGTAAKEPDAAKVLIKFLTAPAAVPVLKAKGMEPVTP